MCPAMWTTCNWYETDRRQLGQSLGRCRVKVEEMVCWAWGVRTSLRLALVSGAIDRVVPGGEHRGPEVGATVTVVG